MAGFAKVSTGILDSSLWLGSEELRLVLLTSLLMAQPVEFTEPVREIAFDSLEMTGYEVPPGWYGWVDAAAPAIVARANVNHERGTEALRQLTLPESASRSAEFDGRRMVRVNGGFLILNFMRFRDHDATAKDRMKRLRQRAKAKRAARKAAAERRAADPLRERSRNVTSRDRNVTATEDRGQRTAFMVSPTEKPVRAPSGVKARPGSAADVAAYFAEAKLNGDAGEWWDHYEANGWVVGKTPMKDWKAACRNWSRRQKDWVRPGKQPTLLPEIDREENERRRRAALGV